MAEMAARSATAGLVIVGVCAALGGCTVTWGSANQFRDYAVENLILQQQLEEERINAFEDALEVGAFPFHSRVGQVSHPLRIRP